MARKTRTLNPSEQVPFIQRSIHYFYLLNSSNGRHGQRSATFHGVRLLRQLGSQGFQTYLVSGHRNSVSSISEIANGAFTRGCMTYGSSKWDKWVLDEEKGQYLGPTGDSNRLADLLLP